MSEPPTSCEALLTIHFLRYLTDLHVQLNSTRRKSRGIKRFLKTKNVSDAIHGYQERVREIKGDFLVCLERLLLLPSICLPFNVDRFTRRSTRVSLYQTSRTD